MLRESTTNRAAGSALMLGIVLSVVVGALAPGFLIVDPVDPADFVAGVEAARDNAGLAHVTSLVVIFATVLTAFGVGSLLRVKRVPGLADMALRFGVGITLFADGLYIVTMGMRHMVTHTALHGVSPGAAQELNAEMALAVFTANAGILFGQVNISAFASLVLGLAVAARFDEFNLFKLAGYGLAATGVARVISLVLLEHLHNVDFGILALALNVLIFLGAVWAFTVGYGIFRGRSELVPEP